MVKVQFQTQTAPQHSIWKDYPDAMSVARNRAKSRVVLFDKQGVVVKVVDNKIVGTAIIS